MKVLITGIGGHLGGRFAHWIKQYRPETEIVGIDNFSCGYKENVPDGTLVHDLTLGHYAGPDLMPNSKKLFYILSDVDYVFHFAAYAAEGLSPFIRRFDCQNNLMSTIDIINACLNVKTVKRIVFTSSMSVYGNQHMPPFDEKMERRPIDAYGISKSACEQHLETAFAQHGQDYCVIRPHNLYGPHQSGWQVFRNVLAYWMARKMQGLPILVYGDGQQTRAFSYIDDVLPCFWAAAVNGGVGQQIINLGGKTPTSIAKAADMCAKITQNGVQYVEPRHEVKYAHCTVQKSVRLLGFRETMPLENGLERMWEWTQWAWDKYPERRNTHKVANIEVSTGLYPFWQPYI